jgi:hypothetical protein
MSKRHPNDGPSRSKATYKASRPNHAPSPDKRKAALEDATRDAEKYRRLRKDPSLILELQKKK